MSDPFDFDAELRAALGDAYAIERELTGSGMSRVFVATERALDRKVVIKVLPPELAAGVNRDRFRREIQLAAQLQHPHIVPLHAAGTHGDLLYFTMPLIEGESLRHALHEGVRFSPREVVRILHDVSDALAYAHARGIIHRDIKPGNVLRSGSHAMVTDFGVAKAISAALPAAGVTTSGMAIGTPAYMAPEQLAGDPAADHRVDIYALGLLGYELLSGEAPFKAPSPQETMAAQLTRVPEPITRRRPDVPPALARLLERCLAKNPADRPQSAAEVTLLLDEIDVSSGAVPARRIPRSRVAALAGVGLFVILVALFWRPTREAPAPAIASIDSAASAPATTSALTREDSLAIARAIQQKFREEQAIARAKAESARAATERLVPPTSTSPAEDFAARMTRMADSIRQAIQDAVLDSVARQRGRPPGVFRDLGREFTFIDSTGQVRINPLTDGAVRVSPLDPLLNSQAFADRRANLGPPRRVFVSYPALPSRLAWLVPAADSLADSLRAVLGREPRFVPIPADTVRQVLAQTRNVTAVANLLNVDLFVSVIMNGPREGPHHWQITLRDLSAHPVYSTRTAAAQFERSAPLASADPLIRDVLRLLSEMDGAPRRRPATRDRRP